MKIYSWNVFYNNSRTKDVIRFINNLDYDVLCLQEVSKELLNKLRKSNIKLVFSIDHKRVDVSGGEECYLVIATRNASIIRSGDIEMPPIPPQALRTRIFVKFMKLFDWTEKTINHRILWADVEEESGKKIRFFNVHLRHGGPIERQKELSIIFDDVSSEFLNIVCGDFNTIYLPMISIFNWVMGSSLREGMPWYSEKVLVNKTLKEVGLKNPLKGKTTHKIMPIQFDHILVPKKWRVLDTKVLDDSIGSDHYPISLQIRL